MAIKTIEQYYKTLEQLHPTTYILGEKVEHPYEHPLIKHMLAGVAQTYALANDEEGKKYLVANSNLTGGAVSRFIHFYESIDDLLAKIKMLKRQYLFLQFIFIS